MSDQTLSLKFEAKWECKPLTQVFSCMACKDLVVGDYYELMLHWTDSLENSVLPADLRICSSCYETFSE